MSRALDVLRVEWELLRRAFPDRSDEQLAASVIERGLAAVEQPPDEHGPETSSADGQVVELRRELAVRAAGVAFHRFDLVTQRDRLARARQTERASYERHLELHKDVVPALKLEAKALRAQVRRLEAEARARGIDLDAIEPSIDWSNTISVEHYSPPRYESNEDRRRAVVEFFRRVGQ